MQTGAKERRRSKDLISIAIFPVLLLSAARTIVGALAGMWLGRASRERSGQYEA